MNKMAKFPVVDHVDSVALFERDMSDTGPYRYMIDGRTVYQHVLFIEPRLLAANPAARRPATIDGSGTPALLPPKLEDLLGARQPVLSVVDEVFATCGIDPEGPHRVGPRLRASGLDVLVGIALPPFEAKQDEDATADDEVRALVRVAQGILILWLRAEGPDCAAFSTPLSPQALDFLDARADVFAASLLAEFAARVPHIIDRDQVLEGIRDTYVGEHSLMDVFGAGTSFPLCDELVAYWLPLWNRAAVIFNSPFDLMSDLGPPAREMLQ
ncbi:MAG: hypothetical protein Q4G36_00235 [Paracoccus sp. (in: a-proteobacteria)]|nr:hypothetical protein [Paracoccus sp. (in: a-proteobacteria)]